MSRIYFERPMLPDWPVPKQALSVLINRMMKAQAHGMSMAGMIPHKPVFEGHGNSIRREDGDFEESDFTVTSGEAAIPIDAIKSGNLQEVLNALRPISVQVGTNIAKSMFAKIEAGIRSVGNDVDCGGKPLTAERILDAFEKVWVNFDDEGQAKWPTLVIPPSQSEHLQTQLARLDSDPALAERFARITELKREEWRVREASRVLVG